MDASLFSLLNGNPAPWLDDLMILASALGKASFIWLAVAMISLVYPSRRMAAWRVALAVGLAYLTVDGMIKPVVSRARPFDVREDVRLIDQRPTSGSFPSGHAASAFAGALATTRLLPQARLLWWLLALLIAVSRIYVGAHWPSDVLAGSLIGFAVGRFALGGRPVAPFGAAASVHPGPTPTRP